MEAKDVAINFKPVLYSQNSFTIDEKKQFLSFELFGSCPCDYLKWLPVRTLPWLQLPSSDSFNLEEEIELNFFLTLILEIIMTNI